jgi:hypothetical protein
MGLSPTLFLPLAFYSILFCSIPKAEGYISGWWLETHCLTIQSRWIRKKSSTRRPEREKIQRTNYERNCRNSTASCFSHRWREKHGRSSFRWRPVTTSQVLRLQVISHPFNTPLKVFVFPLASTIFWDIIRKCTQWIKSSLPLNGHGFPFQSLE